MFSGPTDSRFSPSPDTEVEVPPSPEVDSEHSPSGASAQAHLCLRHYANEAEVAILCRTIGRYHDADDRSGERQRIVEETLGYLGAEWTRRQVRLWFNNNKRMIMTGRTDPPLLPPRIDPPARRSDIDEVIDTFKQLADRLEANIHSADQPARLTPDFIKFQTARMIVRANLPLTHPNHPAFRRWMAATNPTAPLPSVANVRQEILDLAEQFRREVTGLTQGFQFVHLMADTATVQGRIWLGVSLATLTNFYPWRIIEIPDQTGEIMAQHLGELIEELYKRGLVTCGVVTDNAKNEIKTVNLLKSGYAVFRVPCLSHTANLVIKVFFIALYGHRNVFAELNHVFGLLPHAKSQQFHGCPGLVATRWYSLWDFFTYVDSHYGAIRQYLEDSPFIKAKDRPLALEIFRRYDFHGILPFLALICSFIKWSEGEISTLCTAWGLVIHVHRTLHAWHMAGIAYAAPFLHCFAERLTTTADVSEMLMAYLMTRDGLAWYRALTNETVGACRLNQQIVNDLTAPIRLWFVRLIGISADIFDHNRQWYLNDSSFGDKGKVSFWMGIRATQIPLPGEMGWVLGVNLGTLGLLMAMMPVSEAAVERIFSHLRDLLLAQRAQMERELLEARIVIKLNDYPDTITCEKRLGDPVPAELVIDRLASPVPPQPNRRFAAH
jgi:hypothetical protein